MNKLELAHAFALRGIDMEVLSSNYSLDLLVAQSWKYADLMLAEDEKRKDKSLPEVLIDEFEVDWSLAPDWANWWAMDERHKGTFWYEDEPMPGRETWGSNDEYTEAPDFGYKGDWKQSLRKRPE